MRLDIVCTKAAQKAFECIREVEEIATDYDAKSELMRVSREASKAPVTVSPQLMQMLQACQDMSRLSDGAFDITVGRYSLLWRQAQHIGQVVVLQDRQSDGQEHGQSSEHYEAQKVPAPQFGL